MTQQDVLGIGGAFIDVVIPVTLTELSQIQLTPGSSQVTSEVQQKALLAQFADRVQSSSCGGATANTLFLMAQLGINCEMALATGDDNYGELFVSELQSVKVQADVQKVRTSESGSVLVFLTEGGERTFSACPGATAHLTMEHVQTSLRNRPNWLFLEGQLLSYSERTHSLFLELVKIAAESQIKIALSVGTPYIAQRYRDLLIKVLPKIDLLFVNGDEANALTTNADPLQSFNKLKAMAKAVVLTLGADGSRFFIAGREYIGKSHVCRMVNSNGAGDTFAAAILAGIIKNIEPNQNLERAAELAAKVCEQDGARLRVFGV